MEIFQYIGGFIFFLIVVYFAIKFNKSIIAQRTSQARANNPFKPFAQELGLHFEDITPQPGNDASTDKKVFMNTGSRITGAYQGIELEMVFAVKAREADHIPLGSTYAYSYTMERRITFFVKNPAHASFEIRPRDPAIVARPTGHKVFDEKLILLGDATLPSEVLNYFGRLGWMNLQLKGTGLIFNDTFYDQFHGITAGMKMLEAVHPVWGSTLQNTNIDMKRAREFLDMVVKIIMGAGLN